MTKKCLVTSNRGKRSGRDREAGALVTGTISLPVTPQYAVSKVTKNKTCSLGVDISWKPARTEAPVLRALGWNGDNIHREQLGDAVHGNSQKS